MGFAVVTHYCAGLAVDFKLTLQQGELDCGMSDMDQKPCKSKPSHTQEIAKQDCCVNEYQFLELEENFERSVVTGINLDFVVAFVHSFLGWTISSNNFSSYNTNYSAPPIEQDIAVLYQVFRIWSFDDKLELVALTQTRAKKVCLF